MPCGALVLKTADRWHCIEVRNLKRTVSYVLKWKRFLVLVELKDDKGYFLSKKDFSKTYLEADFKSFVWFEFNIYLKKFLIWGWLFKINQWCSTNIFESQVSMGKVGFG